MAIKTGYTLKRGGKKSREIKLLQVAGESFQHRRHRTAKKKKKENNIEKKKRLEQILIEEQDKTVKKVLRKYI